MMTAARLRNGLRQVYGRVKQRVVVADYHFRRRFDLSPTDPRGRVLHAFAKERPDAFIVQIGAHDASQLDPLQQYIRKRRWHGILVEPIPDVFSRLVKNYAGVSDLIFENVAIAPANGSLQLYYLPQTSDEGLPPWYDALASFSLDVLLHHRIFIPDIDQRVETMEVPAVTFDTLCARNDVTHIDLIHIDTEGFDAEVLKLIDPDRYGPAVIQFEELHLDEATRTQTIDRLRGYGYEAIGDGMDCVCVRLDRVGANVQRVWSRVHRGEAVRA